MNIASCHFFVGKRGRWTLALFRKNPSETRNNMGPGARAVHFSLVFLYYVVASKAPPWTTGAPSHFLNSQLLRLILEKYSLFRLSKVDLGNCILSKVLLKTRKLGN